MTRFAIMVLYSTPSPLRTQRAICIYQRIRNLILWRGSAQEDWQLIPSLYANINRVGTFPANNGSADTSRPIKKGLKMKSTIVAVSAMILAANAGFAQGTNYPKAKVSFEDFKGLVAEVETHRASRLVNLNTFLKMSKEPGVIIFDSRSTFRFDRIHVKGAKHLAFTDFTQDNLRQVIPSFETTILIYCNNNFDGNQRDFASKIAAPRPASGSAVASQFAAQAKPIMMALNIPTYVNLYGYGYRNVYELNELVNVNDPRIAFEGSIAEQTPAPLAPPNAK
jgi:hypothetical protein